MEAQDCGGSGFEHGTRNKQCPAALLTSITWMTSTNDDFLVDQRTRRANNGTGHERTLPRIDEQQPG
jgi:hypothetical protein